MKYFFKITLLLITLSTALLLGGETSGQDGRVLDSTIVLAVPGIPGPYCAYGIEKRLLQLEEVKRVQIDWVAEHLVIELRRSDTPPEVEEIEKAIQAADYPYRYTILKRSHENFNETFD
jgi:cation transport ATPase